MSVLMQMRGGRSNNMFCGNNLIARRPYERLSTHGKSSDRYLRDPNVLVLAESPRFFKTRTKVMY